MPGFFRSRLKVFPCQPARFFYLLKPFLGRVFSDIPCLELSAIFNSKVAFCLVCSGLQFINLCAPFSQLRIQFLDVLLNGIVRSPLTHGETIKETSLTAISKKGGLQDKRVIEIPPGDLIGT